MTVKRYIENKNQAVFDETGETLVPEWQIVDVPKSPEMIDAMHTYIHELTSPGFNGTLLANSNCPYCVAFQKGPKRSCEYCPMALANNRCFLKDSSYSKCNAVISAEGRDNQALKAKLIKLAKMFVSKKSKVSTRK